MTVDMLIQESETGLRDERGPTEVEGTPVPEEVTTESAIQVEDEPPVVKETAADLEEEAPAQR